MHTDLLQTIPPDYSTKDIPHTILCYFTLSASFLYSSLCNTQELYSLLNAGLLTTLQHRGPGLMQRSYKSLETLDLLLSWCVRLPYLCYTAAANITYNFTIWVSVPFTSSCVHISTTNLHRNKHLSRGRETRSNVNRRVPVREGLQHTHMRPVQLASLPARLHSAGRHSERNHYTCSQPCQQHHISIYILTWVMCISKANAIVHVAQAHLAYNFQFWILHNLDTSWTLLYYVTVL